MNEQIEYIKQTVTGWPGMTVNPHRFNRGYRRSDSRLKKHPSDQKRLSGCRNSSAYQYGRGASRHE